MKTHSNCHTSELVCSIPTVRNKPLYSLKNLGAGEAQDISSRFTAVHCESEEKKDGTMLSTTYYLNRPGFSGGCVT